MRVSRLRTSWWTAILGLWAAWSIVCQTARSQDMAPPAVPKPASISVEQLAERLSAMEAMNRKLAEELETTKKDHNEQMKQMKLLLDKVGVQADQPKPVVEIPVREPEIVPDPAPLKEPVQAIDLDSPVPDYTEGQFAPFTPPPGYRLPDVPKKTNQRFPLKGTFGPGFQFQTEDERYRLQIHYESQIEGRMWSPSTQIPANSGIFLPRQRIFFNGTITKNIEYEFAINRGFGNLNLLNAYVNFHFDDRFEIRVGRFFTPFNYDQYAISNYWLPTPERSLFTTNVGLNRQFGVMAWGYLFDKRLDYATGIFNGSRNSFENLNNAYDWVTYLNARPFQESKSLPFLRFLNLGTSFAFGYQDQAPVPVSFRIGGGSPTADNPGPGTVPFLILNRDVVEQGNRMLGSVHSAFYRKSLSLISEWQYGYGTYASSGHALPTQVSFSGFYISGGYFLTGEHVERRMRVVPRRPFIPMNPGERRGPGAWEAVARVSQLRLGDQVFKAGFADPNLWSNSALTTELGMNWYWNEYVKVYMFWLHGEFGNPVLYRPNERQANADMFWLRFQLYF